MSGLIMPTRAWGLPAERTSDCPACGGSEWVCEDHPSVRSGFDGPPTCPCEAPARRCSCRTVPQNPTCTVCHLPLDRDYVLRTGRQRHGNH